MTDQEVVSEVRSMLKNTTQVLIIGQSLGEPDMLRAPEIFNLFMSYPMAEIHVYKL